MKNKTKGRLKCWDASDFELLPEESPYTDFIEFQKKVNKEITEKMGIPQACLSIKKGTGMLTPLQIFLKRLTAHPASLQVDPDHPNADKV